MAFVVPELNTIITMAGCACATVQACAGWWAAIKKKKIALLKTNPVLNTSHGAFGGFATALYFLGLFAGLSSFLGAFVGIDGAIPLEFEDSSFNIHTWPSFPIMIVVIWKTYISYFKKKSVYKKGKWLGIATFIAWAYKFITSAISYYVRVEPSIIGTSKPFDVPIFLFQRNLWLLQVFLPFIVGLGISSLILRSASRWEREKEAKKK